MLGLFCCCIGFILMLVTAGITLSWPCHSCMRCCLLTLGLHRDDVRILAWLALQPAIISHLLAGSRTACEVCADGCMCWRPGQAIMHRATRRVSTDNQAGRRLQGCRLKRGWWEVQRGA